MGPDIYDLYIPLVVACVALVVTGALIRLVAVLPAAHRPRPSRGDTKIPALEGNLMLLLGSGGHTGEMIRLASRMNIGACSRTWLVSSNDNSSLQKLEVLEDSLRTQAKGRKVTVEITTLHRARRVKEPLLSSIRNTLLSFASCVRKIYQLPTPDVLLINGPGTCVPVAYVLFFMKYLGLCKTRIVYVESLARVSSLSLSGRLVFPITDRFIVQWEQLCTQYRRAEYYGILV